MDSAAECFVFTDLAESYSLNLLFQGVTKAWKGYLKF